MATVRSLFHYPVKGLTPQPLASVALHEGQGFPFDRVFGIAHFNSGFDPTHPVPLPKDRFFMLRRDERLAALRTHFDTATSQFTIAVARRTVLTANLSSEDGKRATADFFGRMFECDAGELPIVAHASPHRFTDVAVNSPRLMNAISLINLDSVSDFARRIGQEVDPLRFRGNVYFEGWSPLAELGYLDREIRIGAARLRIIRRTKRCAATEVNPATAQRDLATVRLLLQQYQHADMGVYAEVLSDGEIKPGDDIALI
jgi:uncharacterized protein